MAKKWLLLIILMVGSAGCGEAEPTPTVTAPPDPTQTPAAVSEADATAVPSPTHTPTLPPPAVATATLEPTAEATPSPTATPAPVSLLTDEDFGENRSRLTGAVVTDTTVLQRRPIAVKISNAPAGYVRPQSGLNHADLVFEHVTEGPITRFTAVFQSQAPPAVGPIRSARLIDVEVPAMYDAALAYSGSSIGVAQKLGASDIRPRLIRSNDSGYYRTGADKPWEHTLYADPTGLWQALDEKEENHAPAFTSQMAFSSEPPEWGEPATAVTVTYQTFADVYWEYDAENGRYRRWIDGEPHIDANSDEQVSAVNVALVYAIHQLDMSICEFQQGDQCLSFSMEIQIWGQGDAVILRDGRQYPVTWKRENRSDMLTFYDEDDNPVPLQIGNTWFQMIPWHYRDPVAIGD